MILSYARYVFPEVESANRGPPVVLIGTAGDALVDEASSPPHLDVDSVKPKHKGKGGGSSVAGDT